MRVLLIALAASLAGCVTVGRPFDLGQVPSITAGKTTQADLKAKFGEPIRTGSDSGDPSWTYLHYHLSLFNQPQTDDLVVRFNADGTVKSYTFNTTSGADSK